MVYLNLNPIPVPSPYPEPSAHLFTLTLTLTLTPHPSPLTPHLSPLAPHPSPLTSHPRYVVPGTSCHYVVDLVLPDTTDQWAQTTNGEGKGEGKGKGKGKGEGEGWTVVKEARFLDAGRSSSLTRVLALPPLPQLAFWDAKVGQAL